MLDSADLGSTHGGLATFGTGVPLTIDYRQLSGDIVGGERLRDFT
jgi:hypothetical protein